MVAASRLTGALLLLGAVLAGCGNGSGGASSGPPPPSSRQTLTSIVAQDSGGNTLSYAGLPLTLDSVSR